MVREGIAEQTYNKSSQEVFILQKPESGYRS